MQNVGFCGVIFEKFVNNGAPNTIPQLYCYTQRHTQLVARYFQISTYQLQFLIVKINRKMPRLFMFFGAVVNSTQLRQVEYL